MIQSVAYDDIRKLVSWGLHRMRSSMSCAGVFGVGWDTFFFVEPRCMCLLEPLLLIGSSLLSGSAADTESGLAAASGVVSILDAAFWRHAAAMRSAPTQLEIPKGSGRPRGAPRRGRAAGGVKVSGCKRL